MKDRIYAAIDLKSFYASVECIERGLDPMNTNLVVADEERTDKTICLAATPAIKEYGVKGRARLFEVRQIIKMANSKRLINLKIENFKGSSYDKNELIENKDLAIDFIIAIPRMAKYIEVSGYIYDIYLKWVSSDDIHIYSIDEVFIDLTNYIKFYKMDAKKLVQRMIKDIYENTGITATAGIGSNLYLAKVAMDILAKHISPDENGFRIACLDEIEYRRKLWEHRPITDFWRVGRGYGKKLENMGIYTMGDIALASLGRSNDYLNEDRLFDVFGINAELLIDHAWGIESCTMKDIKNYRSLSSSLGHGQVLQVPYSYDMARIVMFEMADTISLELYEKKLVCDQIIINVGYDIDNMKSGVYNGKIKKDIYGRKLPERVHGSEHLKSPSSSSSQIIGTALSIFDKIVDRKLLIRRLNISLNNVRNKSYVNENSYNQISLFDLDSDIDCREEKIQEAITKIQGRYGKNSILRGIDYLEGATRKIRNAQIGGHRS